MNMCLWRLGRNFYHVGKQMKKSINKFTIRMKIILNYRRKYIRNEIVREQLHRMRKNIVPSLAWGIIVVLLCLVSGSYIIKSKTGSDSFIESLHILSTSLLPMLTIGFIGFIVFTICLLLEDSL